MKKLILTAVLGTAMLGLAACDDTADDVDEADTTVVTEEPAPVVTETTVVDPAAQTDDGSTVSVGPDGMSADIDAGDTRVTADSDGNATVTTD